MVVRGSESFLYRKGVTQGDPLLMFMYAVSSLPMISSLDHLYQLTQVWYAEDASACKNLESLREWFYILKEKGPSFGYFSEPSKRCRVCDLREVFANCDGGRYFTG